MRFIATLLRGLAVSPKARSSYFAPRLSSHLEALFLVAAVGLEGKRHAKRQWRDLVRTRVTRSVCPLCTHAWISGCHASPGGPFAPDLMRAGT